MPSIAQDFHADKGATQQQKESYSWYRKCGISIKRNVLQSLFITKNQIIFTQKRNHGVYDKILERRVRIMETKINLIPFCKLLNNKKTTNRTLK